MRKYWDRLWFKFDRASAGKVWKQVCILLIFAVAIVSGLFFVSLFCNGVTFSELVFSTLSPARLSTSMTHRESHQLLWFLIYLVGLIFVSGYLIASLSNMIRSRAERYRQGEAKYCFFKGHLLILGYDDMVIGLLKAENVKKFKHIVVAVPTDISKVRDKLRSGLNAETFKRVVIIKATIDDKEDLERLCVDRVGKLYIIGGEKDELHDVVNLHGFDMIKEICDDKGTEMPICNVHFKNQVTFTLFQAINKQEDKFKYLNPFNFEEMWARRVLAGMDKEYDYGSFLDMRDGKRMDKDSDYSVHVVIAGMTAMGEALAKEVALIAHYPNFKSKGKRTKITFIDKNARENMQLFVGKYRELFKLCGYSYHNLETGCAETNKGETGERFLDLEFEFLDSNIANPKLQDMIEDWCRDEGRFLSIFVCFETSYRSIAAGAYLPFAVYDRKIPVFVYQAALGNIDKYLKSKKYGNVRVFGMSNQDENFMETHGEEMAKSVAYCYSKKPVSEGVMAKEEVWRGCTPCEKWSNIYNASSIPTKLRSLGMKENLTLMENLRELSEDEIETLAEVEHNRWNVEKLFMGFRPANKEERKLSSQEDKRKELKDRGIHPDIMPYEYLDKETKDIDRNLTRNIVGILRDSNRNSQRTEV